jgi:outer membrane protein
MEYEGKKSKLTLQEKKLMEELIHSKQEQFENYQGVIREKIQNEDKELTAKVLGKINDYIKRYGQQKGYRIILAATQYGNIVYAKEDIDITGEILRGLNAEYN